MKHNKSKTPLLSILLAAIVLVPAAMAATITYDQADGDYAPWEWVTLTGTGFTPSSDLTLTIGWPDGTDDVFWGFFDDSGGFTWSSATCPADAFQGTADSAGGFMFVYEKEKVGGVFPVKATDDQGIQATTTFSDSAAAVHNVNFATTGLPTGVSITVSWTKHPPGQPDNTATGSTTFNSPGPSSPNEGTAPNTEFTYTFPSSVTSGSDTYTLKSSTPGSPFTTGADNTGQGKGPESITATYEKTASGTAPSITTQPVSATKAVGESVTFSVTADGTAPLSYQWRKNGSDIPGATGSTFTIDPVAMVDAGSYDVVVTNGYGHATSIAATLTVTDGVAPTTTMTLAPADPDGDNGWYIHNVLVTLAAADNAGGSGVKEIHYILNGVETIVGGATTTFSISTEGTNTLEYWAIDNATPANVETTKTAKIYIDKTPPVTTAALSGTAGNDGWYTSIVTVSLNATDEQTDHPLENGSGVAKTEYSLDNGGTWTTSTSVSISAEGTTTLLFKSTDNAGNPETAKTQVIKIDTLAPVITINTPTDGAVYILRQSVTADWTASDPGAAANPPTGSGFASAVGTVPSGSPIDTGTIAATHTFTVTAYDVAGNKAETTVTYYVHYNFGGFLPPINVGGKGLFKLGSTIPVKFQLTDASGAYVTDAVAHIYVATITGSIIGTEQQPTSTSAATDGNLFRYDPIANQYIFNWGTKGLTAGTWQITADLGDGSINVVAVSLK